MARRRLLRFYFYATYNSVSYDETFTVSSFDATGGTATVTINSSNPWTIEHRPTWVTVTPSYGTKGETNLTLTASENTGQSDLTDTIVFKTNNNQKTITANCTLKGADTPVVSYEVIVNVNNTNLTYSGSTTFNVKLNKTVDGVTTTTDITSTATLTTGGSITVNQNDAIVSGNNSTNYATTGTLKASYTPEGETSAVESTVVTINVAAKPRYSLSVSANPTSIASDGSSTLSAVYNTIIEGQTASTQPVTATYEITSGGNYATINGNILNGDNSTSSNQSVVVKGTYNSVTGSTTVIVQTQATVYNFKVTFSTDPSGSEWETELTVGDDIQAYAYRKTNNGNWVDVTNSVNWTSDDNSVASVGNISNYNKGVIHGEAANTTPVTIKAYDTISGKDDYVEVTVISVPSYDISVSPTTKSIDYQQQSFNVTIYSTGQSWSVDTLPSFVSSVSPASGSEGSTDVTVTCNQNTSSSSRSNTLTFNGNESGSASVEINQSGYNPTPTYRYELKILDRNNTELGYKDITEGNSFNAFAWLYTYNGSTFISSGNVTDDCVWTSDDDSIASVGNTVYDKGEVTGESVGYTNISASYTIDDSTITDYFTINVQEKTHTFTITPTTVTLSSGETETETFVCKYDESVVDNDDCTWSVSTDIQPYVTLVNGVLTLTGTPSDNDVTGTITAQYNGKSAECDVTIKHYEEPVIHPTAITIEISSVEDIPAAGGSVDWSAATYTVTAHYSNGDTRDVTNESIISSNTVSESSKGTVVSGPNIVGQLTINTNYLGLTDDDTIDVSQEANEVVETWEITGETGTVIRETPVYNPGINTYSISVEPTATTVSSESGNITIDVVGVETAPYTAFTTVETEYPRYSVSAYTSTESGQTSLSPVIETSQTGYTESATTANTTCELSSIVSEGFIDGSNYIGNNQWNIQYTNNPSYSERTGTVTYAVQQHSSTTGTITLTQEGKSGPTSRDVTFTVNDSIIENDSNHGPQTLKILSMTFNCSCNDGDISWGATTTWRGELPSAVNTQYPFGDSWDGTMPNTFVLQITYGISAITFTIELTNISGVDENDTPYVGATYRDTVTVGLEDTQTTADLNLPIIVWKNEPQQ